MTAAVVLVVVLAAACGFGLYRRITDGRVRAVRTSLRPDDDTGADTGAADSSAVLSEADLQAVGGHLGDAATLVQFSSSFCAPCRAARVVLGEVAATVPGVVHVEVDTGSHLELADRFQVRRTPTTLLVDPTGRVVHRAVGAPRKADVLGALAPLLG